MCRVKQTCFFFQFHSWTWFCHFYCKYIFPLVLWLVPCSVCFIWKFYFFSLFNSFWLFFSIVCMMVNNELFLFFLSLCDMSVCVCKTGLTFCFCSTFGFFSSQLSSVYNIPMKKRVYAIKCRDYFRRLLRWRCHYHHLWIQNRLKRIKNIKLRRKKNERITKTKKICRKNKRKENNENPVLFVWHDEITHFV